MNRLVRFSLLGCVLAVAVGCFGPTGEQADLGVRIYEAVEGAKPGDEVDLEPVFGTEWDRLVLFDGDPGVATIKEALGFDWSGYSPGMRDGTTVVMVRDSSVVRWGYLPAVDPSGPGEFVDVDLGDPWVEIDPTRIVFLVKVVSERGSVMICYEVCATS